MKRKFTFKKIKLHWLLILFLLSNHAYLPAQLWTGAVSTDWGDPLNWAPNIAPSTGSSVLITAVASNWPELNNDVQLLGFEMHGGSKIDTKGYTIAAQIKINGDETQKVTVLSSSPKPIKFVVTGLSGSYISFGLFKNNLDISFGALNGFLTEAHNQFGGNVYEGNVTITANNNDPLRLFNAARSEIQGNLNIIKTGNGRIYLGSWGADILGNFNFESINTSGEVVIGDGATAGNPPLKVWQKVNIEAQYLYNSTAERNIIINKIDNRLPGGQINILNASAWAMSHNNLIANLNILNFNYPVNMHFNNNSIVGNIQIVDSTYGGDYTGIYFNSNVINGNTYFKTSQNSSYSVEEGYSSGNTFLGDVHIDHFGRGGLYMFKYHSASISGNLTINHSGSGWVSLGENVSPTGNVANINGNLSYLGDKSSGNVKIGIPNTNNKINIAGKIDITVNSDTTAAAGRLFYLFNTQNNTVGGNIFINEPLHFSIQNCNVLASATLNNFHGGLYSQRIFANNQWTGNLKFFPKKSCLGQTIFSNNNIYGQLLVSKGMSDQEYYFEGVNFISN